MSVHLVGGGWHEGSYEAVYGPFGAEATQAAAARERTLPRVLVVSIREDAGEHAEQLISAIGTPMEPLIVAIGEDDDLPAQPWDDLDAVIIGGGLGPAYHRAVLPHADALRSLVERGVPYLGFSTGATIASSHALLGGWLLDGVPVAHEDTAEDLEPVTVVPGLGLVPFTVGVHAAQWGTLATLIAATEAGLVSDGYAIDEGTALRVGDGLSVTGRGNAWHVRPAADGVLVNRLRG